MTSASASRVTRSSRSLRVALLLFASGLAAAGILRAQEPKAPEETAETTEGTHKTDATGQPEAAAAEQPAVAEPVNDDGKSAPESATGSDDAEQTPPPNGPSPNRFEPTEKVRADFDVSFPIDI
jgi:cytoskeletal protein RodZ